MHSQIRDFYIESHRRFCGARALTGLRVGQVTNSIYRTIGIISLVNALESRILEACGVVESDASLIKLVAPRKDRQKKE